MGLEGVKLNSRVAVIAAKVWQWIKLVKITLKLL